jgi:cobalamin biosynthesis protein CobT
LADARRNPVFHNHPDAVSGPSIDPPQVRTVRLLETDEELQSAIERVRDFERRANYRRVGAYDRTLNKDQELLLDQLMRSFDLSIGLLDPA